MLAGEAVACWGGERDQEESGRAAAAAVRPRAIALAGYGTRKGHNYLKAEKCTGEFTHHALGDLLECCF